MDGGSSSQEASKSETAVPSDTNNSNQTEEPEVEESKETGRGPLAGQTPEEQRVEEIDMRGQEDPASEEVGAQDRGAEDKSLPAATKHVESDPDAKDKASTDVDSKEMTGEKKDGEGERDQKCETRVEGEEMKGKKDEKGKTEGKAKEEKDVSEKAAEVAEKKKDEETKDKQKITEVEKQGKPKRKGPPASSLSRPRTSARSIRSSAKNDIIAKFQRGAPETPIPRNFKIQKSATASATGASIKQKILHWCQNKTRNYEGITIENFSSSWCNGMAFCTLIHRFFPDAFDYNSLNPTEREKNLTLAFQTAESLADCYPLLEVGDMLMMGNNPDPMCVFTYVQSLCHSLCKIEKERRDKEKVEKDTAGDGGEKGGDGAEEGKSAEITESQEETEDTCDEENAPISCETEGNGGVCVDSES